MINLQKLSSNIITFMAAAGLLVGVAFATQNNPSEPAGKSLEQTAKVNIKLSMLSDKKMDVIVRIPSQLAYGFPGKATTPEQNATVDNVVDGLKENISQIVALNPELKCTHKVNDIDKFESMKSNYEVNHTGTKTKTTTEYLVLKADVTVSCEKPLPKQLVNVDFGKYFKSVDKYLVEVDGKTKRKFTVDKSTESAAPESVKSANSSGSFAL